MCVAAWFLAILIGLTATGWGQPPDPSLPGGQFDPSVSFDSGKEALGEGSRVSKFEAGFTAPAADGSAQLFVEETVPTGAHTFSITQPDGGPLKTIIEVAPLPNGITVGDFQAVQPPHVVFDKDSFPPTKTFPKGIPMEEHDGTVKWVAPIRFAAGVRPDAVKLQGKVRVQLCDAKGCAMPRDYLFTAGLRTDVKPVAVSAPAKTKPTLLPGPTPEQGRAGNPSPPTPLESTQPSAAPPNSAPPNAEPPHSVPADQKSPGSSDGSSASAQPRTVTADGEIEWLPFTNAAGLKEIVGPQFDLEQIREHVRKEDLGLGFLGAVCAGFLGGLILNVMPCVLPVIGLKILSFVQQAGHNRRKAFMLNFWYSAGLLTVFFILASLAVGPQKLGWGELFGRAWFAITLTAVVFVMALSFLGVWEVPLPAFIGGGKAGELAAHEGGVGAFFKGALTTFLATPCSAMFLAPALVWAAAQPAWLTYVVFLSMGLGMASPYLLIGAFPELMRFLPKPGAWMETFKQVMGFVLMGTVVYFLAVLDPVYVVPTVGLLFGLSFMCWWVGRISPLADAMAQFRTWAQGAAFVCVVWIVMFPGLNESILGRYHFSGVAAIMAERLGPATHAAATRTGLRVVGPNTVLVDFTADWCQNCHFYENTVLRSSPVVDALRRLGVVAVKADWSHDDSEVTSMLDVLNGKQIPVIAVFSARDPNHPKIFRGVYSQKEILDALEKAGPSPAARVASR
jgi:thiol:disulfide interchange protein